jgi:hypothetical protein
MRTRVAVSVIHADLDQAQPQGGERGRGERLRRDCPDIGRSCRFGKGQVCIADPVKSMTKSGTERAVVDCAANLEQQIGAIS